MASSLVKVLRQGQRASGLLEQAGKTLAVQKSDLHTSQPAQGTLTIPERLQGIPEAAVSRQKIGQMIYLHMLFSGPRILRDG